MIVNNLCVRYGAHAALEIPSLTLPDAGVTAILGPNGAGKTTLLKALAGVLPVKDAIMQSVPRPVAYMAQQPYLFRMSVLDNVLLGVSPTAENRRRAMSYLAELRIDHLAERKAGALSGGERQRAALARTMMVPAKLICLDEPTAAADVEGVLLIEQCIQAAAARGARILIATHNPSQAIRIADSAILLWEGQVADSGTPRELLLAPKTPNATQYAAQWRMG